MLDSSTGRNEGPAVDFSAGPRDSEPVISPNGHTAVFLRAAEKGPAQLHSIELHGGEATALTSHPLGAARCVFSPDGERIAYLAAVPEEGRYGTDAEAQPAAEPPRAIGRMSYRLDGKGFIVDKPEQVFLLELRPGAEPVQLTDEPSILAGPVFLPDGRLGYVRSTAPDVLQCEFAAVEVGAGGPVIGDRLISMSGDAAAPVVSGDTLYYVGVEFEAFDSAGRTAGLWAVPAVGGTPRRLTDIEIEVDSNSPPVVLEKCALISVLDRGTVSVRAVDLAADRAPLEALRTVIGGQRVAGSFGAAVTGGGAIVAATVAYSGQSGGRDHCVGRCGRTTCRRGTDADRPGHRTSIRWSGTARGDQRDRPGRLPGARIPGVARRSRAAPGTPGRARRAPRRLRLGCCSTRPRCTPPLGTRWCCPTRADPRATAMNTAGPFSGDWGPSTPTTCWPCWTPHSTRSECDADRVGVMGGSYGGFMTSWLASHAPDRFTAAISERAVNAWDSFAGSSDIGYFFAESYVGADRDSQWRASPLANADQIAVPLLIIHSEQDWRCPLEQGQRLFVALKNRGAEVEMLLFPGEGHELSRSGRPRHRLQRFQAILNWWQRHLPVAGRLMVSDSVLLRAEVAEVMPKPVHVKRCVRYGFVYEGTCQAVRRGAGPLTRSALAVRRDCQAGLSWSRRRPWRRPGGGHLSGRPRAAERRAAMSR